jgi:hypothetical protein
MKWPWNAPETPLSESDSARLRRLEATIVDMGSDLEICLNTIPKINARLRQRAVRETNDDGTESEIVPENLPPVKGFRAVSREELLTRAKAKGLR